MSTVEEEPFSARLLAKMDALTSSERQVARAILADYPMAALDSVAALAHKAGVSPPTVVRFATKFGFSGWPEFQSVLRIEVSKRLASPLSLYHQMKTVPRTSADHPAGDIFLDALASTFSRLKDSVLSDAVEMLVDPKARVYVIGGRFSSALGGYFATHLQMLRTGVTSVSELPIRRTNALLEMNRNDVLVALDFRRYQRDTIDFGRAAAERGARIILVTDPWLSPLVGDARLVLGVETTSPSPFDSFLSALGVLELLIYRLADSIGPDSLDRMSAHDALNQSLMLSEDET
jgi:DNA-binding MurR/RpiR family transcriptional regulator